MVPGVMVDYIVIAPDQMQTTNTVYEPAISGECLKPRITDDTSMGFRIAMPMEEKV